MTAMSATRLLVLGVVRKYGKAHGYLVRNELMSWGIEECANIKWGSIYHALKQLTKEGLLEATSVEAWPVRVDYAMTAEGEQEFFEELREALVRPDHRPDMLGAGVVLLPALPRGEAIALLKQRLHALEREREKMVQVSRMAGEAERPPHVRELPAMWIHAAKTGAEWTRGLIERLEGGAYAMANEPASPHARTTTPAAGGRRAPRAKPRKSRAARTS